MTVVVTGAAGFIGMHVAERLLRRGERVIGVDVFNDYYDPALKEARAARLETLKGFRMVRMDLADAPAFEALVRSEGAARVVHLAAQAGVRYSIDHPFAYQHSNLAGHLSVLEACRRSERCEHLVYASSSSVYGQRPLGGQAFSEEDPVDAPASLYAATKRAGELMSTTYASLYGLPQSGLRFFTVYGPWGRPDMAYWMFTEAMLAGRPIHVFNNGEMWRDYTYIDDAVRAVLAVMDGSPSVSSPPHRIYNVGNNRPVQLGCFIDILEETLGVKAIRKFEPMQLGDVERTYADISSIERDFSFHPSTSIEEGIRHFAEWYIGGWSKSR